ncbi:hypothetical protein QJQ45_022228, partial [Haematococcus lacustris]
MVCGSLTLPPHMLAAGRSDIAWRRQQFAAALLARQTVRENGCYPRAAAATAAAAACQQVGTHAPDQLALGFLGIQGVDSPDQLQHHWFKKVRPRLEALTRACAAAPARPALLPLVDQLLFELQQVHTPARHCAACHANPAWRCAAEAVTLSCSKYEQYLYSSAGLHAKLQQVHTTLQALVRSTGASEAGAAAPAAAGAPQEQGQPRGSPSSHPAAGRAVRLCDGQGRLASSTEQLRLCQLLLAAFKRWGMRAHGGLPNCPDLGGAARQTSSEDQGKERQLAEAVREALLKLPPKQQLLQVSLPAAARATSTKYGGGEGEEEAGLAGSSPEAHTTEPEAGSVGAGSGGSGSDGSGTGGAQARR